MNLRAVRAAGVELSFKEIMIKAVELSCITTSGFVVAFLIATVLLTILTLRSKNAVRKSAAQLGWIMIAVEFLDALPEAAMLAEQCFNSDSSLALITSLFFMNISNGFVQTFDMMSTVDSLFVSGLLFVVLHFCVGLLSYSIAADVYGDFEEEWTAGHLGIEDVIALLMGTIIGCSFVLVLNLAINWRQAQKTKQIEMMRMNEEAKERGDAIYHEDVRLLSTVFVSSSVMWKMFAINIGKTVMLLCGLFVWSVGWTCAFAALLHYLLNSSEFSIETMASFLEGAGGGAFLATIACTILPEIGHYYEILAHAYGDSQLKMSLIGMLRVVCYVFGLCVAAGMDIIS